MALNDREIALVKGMLARGDAQHHIAAYFGENSARVNDIKSGKDGIGSGISPAAENDLPPPGPYIAGRVAQKARDTLLALRELIDDTLQEIDADIKAAVDR